MTVDRVALGLLKKALDDTQAVRASADDGPLFQKWRSSILQHVVRVVPADSHVPKRLEAMDFFTDPFLDYSHSEKVTYTQRAVDQFEAISQTAVEEAEARVAAEDASVVIAPSASNARIFISHSDADESVPIATEVVHFLEAAFGLNRKQIFCTRVPGCNPPIGSNAKEHIINTISKADVVIAVLCKNASVSQWVGVEIGSAEGAKKPIFPLLASLDRKDIPNVFQEKMPAEAHDSHSLRALYQDVADALRLNARTEEDTRWFETHFRAIGIAAANIGRPLRRPQYEVINETRVALTTIAMSIITIDVAFRFGPESGITMDRIVIVMLSIVLIAYQIRNIFRLYR